jgi:hypothetical protein
MLRSVARLGLRASWPLILWDSCWCPEGDLNPHDRLGSADFKSLLCASNLFIIIHLVLKNVKVCK